MKFRLYRKSGESTNRPNEIKLPLRIRFAEIEVNSIEELLGLAAEFQAPIAIFDGDDGPELEVIDDYD